MASRQRTPKSPSRIDPRPRLGLMMLETIHERWVIGRRATRLAEILAEFIPASSSLLDVGSGDGRVLAGLSRRRPDLFIRGLDTLDRLGAWPSIDRFNGETFPCDDGSCDVVSFVDVLHHANDPMRLLVEAKRVARRAIVIKDHLMEGVFAGVTLRFMDRVGNRRFGVPTPYRYWTRDEWKHAFDTLEVKVAARRDRLGLYPFPASLVFDRGLHFVARLEWQNERGEV